MLNSEEARAPSARADDAAARQAYRQVTKTLLLGSIPNSTRWPWSADHPRSDRFSIAIDDDELSADTFAVPAACTPSSRRRVD